MGGWDRWWGRPGRGGGAAAVVHPRWLAGFSGSRGVCRMKTHAPLWGTVPRRGGLKSSEGTPPVFEVRIGTEFSPDHPRALDLLVRRERAKHVRSSCSSSPPAPSTGRPPMPRAVDGPSAARQAMTPRRSARMPPVVAVSFPRSAAALGLLVTGHVIR